MYKINITIQLLFFYGGKFTYNNRKFSEFKNRGEICCIYRNDKIFLV